MCRPAWPPFAERHAGISDWFWEQRMRTIKLFRRYGWLFAAPGILLINSCMAATERGLDTLLSPEAAGNLAGAPYSAVAGVLSFLMHLAHG
jgi:hypothetical protein